MSCLMTGSVSYCRKLYSYVRSCILITYSYVQPFHIYATECITQHPHINMQRMITN